MVTPRTVTTDNAVPMTEQRAREIVASVVDPELPVLTLAELGVVRGVRVDGGTVVVTLTPTYSGCPAMAEMRADIRHALAAAGCPDVEIHTVLSPAWTTDWITASGRRKLAEHGIAPPGPAPRGPIPLRLSPPAVACPRCGSTATETLSRFSSTACKSLHRCRACAEPFEHVKAI